MPLLPLALKISNKLTMKWNLATVAPADFINSFPEIDHNILQLLYNRQLTEQKSIDEFLYPDYSRDIHDPYLFRDMTRAVQRIVQAHQQKEKIAIYGDYDADGVCGSAILYRGLSFLGFTDLITYIPHREKEGYGVNKQAIDYLSEQGVKLVITVDCGISNRAEVKYAQQQYQMDVIISDHHDLPEFLPDAIAIIHCRLANSSYPYAYLSGGATGFKLVQGLLREPYFNISTKQIEGEEKWLLDVVACSIIGDMVPLLGENRTLTKYGLIVWQRTKRLGLQKLMELINIDPQQLDIQKISWQLVPRLNAAGRMKHANTAYQLLVTENIAEAITLASELNQSNIDRQKLTEQYVQMFLGEVVADFSQIAQQTLLFYHPGLMIGLLGLVAGKLADKLQRPVFVLTDRDQDIVGSGRSIDGYHITNALQKLEHYLVQYGGHMMACGLVINKDKFELFKKEIENDSRSLLLNHDLAGQIFIEQTLSLAAVDWPLFESIQLFAPFGEDNEEPIFLITQAQIVNYQLVGKDEQHLRLTIGQNGERRKAIAFNMADKVKLLKSQSDVDLAVKIIVNEWHGYRELQLKVIDIRN